MQIKTVAKSISDKLKDWLSSITDEQLRKEVEESLLVSGGSITSLLLGDPVNDYDIYLQDIEVVKRLTIYYIKGVDGAELLDGREKEALVKELEKQYIGVTTEGEEAVNRNNSRAISLRNLKEDQIKLYFPSANGGLKVNENLSDSEKNYTPVFLSPNAISLSNDIQIVIRFHGTPEQIHKTFDFIHATITSPLKKGWFAILKPSSPSLPSS